MTAENVAASEPEDVSGASYTNLLCSIAAAMKLANSGCGSINVILGLVPRLSG